MYRFDYRSPDSLEAALAALRPPALPTSCSKRSTRARCCATWPNSTLADASPRSVHNLGGGSYDVVALVRVKSNEDIADMVTERMVKIEGIDRTETLIAFKTYSRHDLESVFSIGLDVG